MSLVDDAFTALFYGEGSWLGLLLFIFLMLGFTLKWKYAGALFIPISILVGIEYLNRDLAYQSMIMFLLSPFMVILIAYEGRKGR